MGTGDNNSKFKMTSNLREHAQNKHPVKLEELAPKGKHNQSVVQCLGCNKNFVSFGILRRHVKNQHPDKLNTLAPLRKKIYKCPNCSDEFEALKHLKAHKEKHQTHVKLKCVLCDYTGRHRQHIIGHYRAHHFVQIECETLHFESMTDFQLWKSKIEKTTYSFFSNKYGTKKHAMFYPCHRSGQFRPKGKNNRKLKIQGSNKIGGYCPAMISTVFKNNRWEVKYCKTHIGHGQQDLKHLYLSKSQRQSIATKIAAKIPFQTILDEVRDSVTDCHLERLHLLTKKDLFNIEHDFKLNSSSVRHSNDAISMQEDFISDTENESSLLVSTVSSRRQEHKNFEEEKMKYLNVIFSQLNEKISTFEELEATKRFIDPIVPTLEAMKNHKLSEAPAVPATKNIIPQRGLFSSKKKVTRKKLVLQKPSPEVSDTLAMQMMHHFDR